ncbi:hypothetical protein AX15_003689 [Amanita polypyramis BW_CC]|nr:hypothetical protein AX15_003689 [Amanita polypyramis BW_CC]
MATYFGVLPADLLCDLTARIDHKANFLRLPHPRTGLASLFMLVHDSKETPSNVQTILEVQAIAPTEARSWFLNDEVVSDGRLLLMTPVDPVFLLLPLLQAADPPGNGFERHFRPADDIFEDAARTIEEQGRKYDDISYSISARDILQFTSFQCTRDSLQRICDVKEVTSDIIVYRFNDGKILEYLRRKVSLLASPQVIESSKTLLRSLAKNGLFEEGNEKLLEAGRTRAACEILCQYLPKNIGSALVSSYDFGALDDYLKGLRDEVTTSADTKAKHGSTSSTKSGENKKRKSKASQGVEKLKKANVNGMAKLSNYFKKA